MEGYFWKTLLVLGALSTSGRGEPSHKPLTYQKALELGVANYNSKAGEDSLYQLLEAVPQPEWDPNSEGTQELKFTIKETVCPVEEGRALEECDFKEDGVVRECTGNYFLGEKPPLAFVTCDAVEGIEEEEEEKEEDEEEDRSRRRKLRRRLFRRDQPERFKKLKKLFKKIKKGTKKGIKRVTKTGAQIFFKKQILGKIAG